MSDERFRLHGGVYMVLIEDGRIFLLRRANTGYRDGYWNLPGGHMEENENPEDAARREALEEAGVTIEAEDAVFGYSLFRRGYGGRNRTYADYLFVTTRWQGKAHNAELDKASDGAWFKLSELPTPMIEPQKRMLEDYLNGGRYAAVMENEV